MNIKDIAIQTIKHEYNAVINLENYINDDFQKAVEVIHESKGRVVITGIGKSAIIAQKIAATMNSTGTPALFMHAADAIHGDLGMIQQDDVVIIISKSGESPEIKALVPLVNNFGNITIALCGNDSSFLVQQSKIFINSTVSQEACPNNLAPTTSTTAQLVMGDALAICLLQMKGFTPKDFAKYHPGGALGKRLYATVADIMQLNEVPLVHINDNIRKVIIEISSKRLGATAVVDNNEVLIGIITDGDLRRMLENHDQVSHLVAKDIMTHSPKYITTDSLAVIALQELKNNNISQLPVIENGKYKGIIHIHDLLREGII